MSHSLNHLLSLLIREDDFRFMAIKIRKQEGAGIFFGLFLGTSKNH